MIDIYYWLYICAFSIFYSSVYILNYISYILYLVYNDINSLKYIIWASIILCKAAKNVHFIYTYSKINFDYRDIVKWYILPMFLYNIYMIIAIFRGVAKDVNGPLILNDLSSTEIIFLYAETGVELLVDIMIIKTIKEKMNTYNREWRHPLQRYEV